MVRMEAAIVMIANVAIPMFELVSLCLDLSALCIECQVIFFCLASNAQRAKRRERLCVCAKRFCT